MSGKVDKKAIFTAIENLILSANEKDRIIIYISTHGFEGSVVKSRGYIAPYDCDQNDVENSCIELDELEEKLQGMIKKSVKHLLVVLDSCAF